MDFRREDRISPLSVSVSLCLLTSIYNRNEFNIGSYNVVHLFIVQRILFKSYQRTMDKGPDSAISNNLLLLIFQILYLETLSSRGLPLLSSRQKDIHSLSSPGSDGVLQIKGSVLEEPHPIRPLETFYHAYVNRSIKVD